MTASELRNHFNTVFGLGKWPAEFHVDAETYGNVCQQIFDENSIAMTTAKYYTTTVVVGPKNGIMFKNVELIIEREKENEDG